MAELKKVKDGKVDVDGFVDGTTVLVMSPDEEKPYVLSDEEEKYIEKSIDQLERGEGMDAFEHLKSLR